MPLATGNMGGVGDLVKALTGRGAVRQQAEADAWKQADNIGRAKKATAEAGIAQDELAMRTGSELVNAIVAMGGDRNSVPIMRAGFANFPQAVQGQSGIYDLGQTRQAGQMATQENPDVAMMNRVLAARTSGGGPLNPNQVDPEGLAAALLATEQAQAGNYRASADATGRRTTAYEQDVRSRADDRLLDNARGGGSGGTGGAASNTLTPDVMEMFKVAPPRSPPGTPRVFDAARYEQFLADRSSMGGTGNISEDARAWFVRQNPETRKVPIIIDPTNPESMKRSPPAPMREPPVGAIQKLRANPNLRAQFDEWYGPGSAARALGGQ